ncbi:hypothetical protein ACU4GD_35925 [Cupriavidus basilensis]
MRLPLPRQPVLGYAELARELAQESAAAKPAADRIREAVIAISHAQAARPRPDRQCRQLLQDSWGGRCRPARRAAGRRVPQPGLAMSNPDGSYKRRPAG